MIDFIGSFPVLVTEDLTALKLFYIQNFGFEAEFFQEDFYLHLKHPGNGTQLGYMVPNHPSQPSFLHPLAGNEGMVLSFEVADANAAYKTAKETSLDIVFELKVEPFGLTHFMVRDPAGIIIDIVEHQQQ